MSCSRSITLYIQLYTYRNKYRYRYLYREQVPVQRVTKYPLLLARLYKVTPEHHLEARQTLNEARHKIQLHLEHINSVSASLGIVGVSSGFPCAANVINVPFVCSQLAKDISSTKLWRKIYAINGKRPDNEDLADIKFRKVHTI